MPVTIQNKKRSILIFVATIVIVLTGLSAISMLDRHNAQATLKQVSARELQALKPHIDSMLQGRESEERSSCFKASHTITNTQLFCVSSINYPHISDALHESSLGKVTESAKALDRALAQNGWQASRPQDRIKTIAESIPASIPENPRGWEVPFHKNIGDVSCNLGIDFNAPTAGASPGAINVSQYSCQHDIEHFQMHLSNNPRSNFGP